MIHAVHSSNHELHSLFSESRERGAEKADVVQKAEEEKEPGKLTDEEQAQVRKLQQRDAEVRAHEAAHQAAAGGLANGGPSYNMQRGPDGKNYAIGGHVSIDTSKGRTPEETLQRSSQIRAAALAPSDPSGQDLKVAAAASQMAAEARQELQKEKGAEAEGENSDETAPVSASAATGGNAPAEVHHGDSASHIRQCPDCLQKYFGAEPSSSKEPEESVEAVELSAELA